MKKGAPEGALSLGGAERSVPHQLHPHHRQMLERESGIDPAVIAERGYWTETTKAGLKRLGFSDAQCNAPALVLPLYAPHGRMWGYQIRPDTPRIGKRGRVVKYETPNGARMGLDVPPRCREAVRDPKTPLYITEGVKKGDALATHGLCAVALLGVWNWRGANEHGGKTAVADFEAVALNDRRVYIVFDSDVMEKREVTAALGRLKGFLEQRKANVALIYLPPTANGGKQGVDDYLAAGHSIEDLLQRATTELRGQPKEQDGHDRFGVYVVKDGALHLEKQSQNGPVLVPIANFDA